MSGIQISNEMVALATTKAILEGLSGDAKEAIIGEAIKSLLEVPNRGHYHNDKRTRIQEAFDSAIYSVAQRVAGEELSKPENAEKIRELVAAAISRAFDGGRRESLLDRMADGLTSAFTKGD